MESLRNSKHKFSPVNETFQEDCSLRKRARRIEPSEPEIEESDPSEWSTTDESESPQSSPEKSLKYGFSSSETTLMHHIIKLFSGSLVEAYSRSSNTLTKEGFIILFRNVLPRVSNRKYWEWKFSLPHDKWDSIQCIKSGVSALRGKSCRFMWRPSSKYMYPGLKILEEAVKILFTYRGHAKVSDLYYLKSVPDTVRQIFHCDNNCFYRNVVENKSYKIHDILHVPFSIFIALEEHTYLWVSKGGWDDSAKRILGKYRIYIPKGGLVMLPSYMIHAGDEYPPNLLTLPRSMICTHYRGFMDTSSNENLLSPTSQLWFIEKGNKYGPTGRQLTAGLSDVKPNQYKECHYNLENDSCWR